MEKFDLKNNGLERRLRISAIKIRERLLQRDSIAMLEQWKDLRLTNINTVQQLRRNGRYSAAHYAYQSSPFYRHVYSDAGINEHDLINQNGWNKIPILEKETIREKFNEIYSTDYQGRCVNARTSGSTGLRLVFDVDMKYPVYGMAAARRGQDWWGVGVGAKIVRIWGTYRGIDSSFQVRLKMSAKNIIDKICGTTSLSAFTVTDEECKEKVKQITSINPEMIFGYGTALFLVADYVIRNGLTCLFDSVRLVVYTSEFLSTWQREKISEAFSCPTVSEYGSVETGVIAYDCPCGMQHINQECLDLEVLREDGTIHSTGCGEAIVTHYYGKKLPLIRYRLGDMIEVVESDTRCKNGFIGKSIKSLSGRKNDIIYSPSGKPIHPELFDYIMRTISGIKKFQIREDNLGQLSILLEVLDKMMPEKLSEQVMSVVSDQLKNEFQISVSVVSKIENSESGKFRWVVGNPNH